MSEELRIKSTNELVAENIQNAELASTKLGIRYVGELAKAIPFLGAAIATIDSSVAELKFNEHEKIINKLIEIQNKDSVEDFLYTRAFILKYLQEPISLNQNAQDLLITFLENGKNECIVCYDDIIEAILETPNSQVNNLYYIICNYIFKNLDEKYKHFPKYRLKMKVGDTILTNVSYKLNWFFDRNILYLNNNEEMYLVTELGVYFIDNIKSFISLKNENDITMP